MGIINRIKNKLRTNVFNGVDKIQVSPLKKVNKQRFLMFVCLDEKGINTVKETIYELIEKSAYQIDLVNIFGKSTLHQNFKFHHYDGIIIHNSMTYFIESTTNVDSVCNQKIADFKGIKIIYKQDEHFRHNKLIDYLEKVPFDLVITICDHTNFRQFYPESRLPNLRYLNYLTGYVKESHRNLPYANNKNRTVDVGYRGSIQPPVAGMLSFEKRQIGTEFEKYAQKRGLVTDISSRWEDRFMGDSWYKFLGNCKATLGVESGASIVDLDGSVDADYNAFKEQNPNATDEEVLVHLSKYESGPQYRAISPRHFEAAACKTLQVMYEGYFQGIFVPGRHFVELKRDFSNVDQVIDIINDDKERERITNCAYEEIIMNNKYSYSHFVKMFDNEIDEILKDR